MKDFSDSIVQKHFDEVATDYDFWKKKNWYYYDALKKIAGDNFESGDRVLDAGCGTGTILFSLGGDVNGLGVDISKEMIDIANSRRPTGSKLNFLAADIGSFKAESKFDLILFFDVVEHVPDMAGAMRSLSALISDRGRLLITMANPLWEPILLLAEKLGLKMPEGPHNRITTVELECMANQAGLQLKSINH